MFHFPYRIRFFFLLVPKVLFFKISNSGALTPSGCNYFSTPKRLLKSLPGKIVYKYEAAFRSTASWTDKPVFTLITASHTTLPFTKDQVTSLNKLLTCSPSALFSKSIFCCLSLNHSVIRLWRSSELKDATWRQTSPDFFCQISAKLILVDDWWVENVEWQRCLDWKQSDRKSYHKNVLSQQD